MTVESELRYRTGLVQRLLPVDNAAMLVAIAVVAVIENSVDTVAVVVLEHTEHGRPAGALSFCNIVMGQ